MRASQTIASICIFLIVGGAGDTAHASAPAPTDHGKAWDGHWVGTIFVQRGRLEVDVSVDIDNRGPAPSATIGLPQQGILGRPLDDVQIAGDAIAFVFNDQSVASEFRGRREADGKIVGEVHELGKTFAFELARGATSTAAAARAPAVGELSGDGAELTARFASDHGKVRLLLIVSPTCEYCRNHARIVRNYVLRGIADPRLRVYVVWENILPGDDAAAAAAASALLPDPRVVQFHAAHRFAGMAFKEALALHRTLPWDVVLVFGAEQRWGPALPAPAPSFYMHNLHGATELPEGRRIDGPQLAERVRSLLGAAGAPTTPTDSITSSRQGSEQRPVVARNFDRKEVREHEERHVRGRGCSRWPSERHLHLLRRQTNLPHQLTANPLFLPCLTVRFGASDLGLAS